MKMDENLLSEPRSGVKISITSPSRNTSEDEMEEEFIPRASKNSNRSGDSMKDSSGYDSKSGSNGGYMNGEAFEGEDLSSELESGLSLREDQELKDYEENGAKKEKDLNKELDEKPANLEMIGDRVLIERDGKFELVDVSEIKAEYFEMLGINPEEKKAETTESNGVAVNNGDSENKKEKSPQKTEEKPPIKQRPQTTNVSDHRRRKERKSKSPERRSTSAKFSSRNDEYSHIKSIYGMTEEQLKIKRRREEAIAKRKKEEKEREEEELRRKREDAERAFQAWLTSKLEEAKERRRAAAQNKSDKTLEQRKSSEAQQAYEEWLVAKRQQNKVAREYEQRRRLEEASQFIIRDRQLCDEAFRRWLKKKRADARAKAMLKKRKRPKPKVKKKEPLPLNSKNITYLEYYGYRNDVVL